MHGSKAPLKTRSEVARMVGVSSVTVHRWREKGDLPGVLIGNTYRYRIEDVEALMSPDSPVMACGEPQEEDIPRIEPLHDPAAAPLTRIPASKRAGPPYKIAFISPCWHRGGLEVVTIMQIEALDRAMWEPIVLTGDVIDMDDSLPEDVELIVCHDAFEWTFPPASPKFKAARAAATKVLREIKPDVVIGQLAHASMFAANDIGTPVLLEYHHCGWNWDVMEHPSDAIISVSEHTALRVHGQGRLPAVPAYLVYNGIDTKRFHSPSDEDRADVRQYLGFADTDKVVGWSGRFAQEKRPVEWVSALANIKDFHEPKTRGLMVGPMWESECYTAARERADKRGLTWHSLGGREDADRLGCYAPNTAPNNEADIVHIHVPYDEMPRMYAAMDCLMHPRPDEPFGLVIPEALMCGVPVVGVVGGGLPEIYDILGMPPYMDLCEAGDMDEMSMTVALHLEDGRVPPEYAEIVAGVFCAERMTETFQAIVLQYLAECETEGGA